MQIGEVSSPTDPKHLWHSQDSPEIACIPEELSFIRRCSSLHCLDGFWAHTQERDPKPLYHCATGSRSRSLARLSFQRGFGLSRSKRPRRSRCVQEPAGIELVPDGPLSRIYAPRAPDLQSLVQAVLRFLLHCGRVRRVKAFGVFLYSWELHCLQSMKFS